MKQEAKAALIALAKVFQEHDLDMLNVDGVYAITQEDEHGETTDIMTLEHVFF
ncbi:hypothetical protein OAF54_01710 [bacterium]|nr:hypothetical protein [bacterium]